MRGLLQSCRDHTFIPFIGQVVYLFVIIIIVITIIIIMILLFVCLIFRNDLI